MNHYRNLLYLCTLFNFFGTCPLYGDINLYVAKNGSDSWTGRASEPDTSGTDGPFATIEQARQAIRNLKSAGTIDGNIYVTVSEGTYYLDSPFALDAVDSGTDSYAIVYRGPPGEKAVLSGARRIEAT